MVKNFENLSSSSSSKSLAKTQVTPTKDSHFEENIKSPNKNKIRSKLEQFRYQKESNEAHSTKIDVNEFLAPNPGKRGGMLAAEAPRTIGLNTESAK